jgi:hypothetical protein
MHDWSSAGVPHPNSPAGQHFDWSSAGIPHPNSPVGHNSTNAATLTYKQRFVEVLKLTPDHMAPELAAQFRAMLTPSSMMMMAATFTALAVSQAFGVGEIVDVILLVVGAFFVGMAAFTAAKDIVECVKLTVRAKTPADLDRAADYLAQAVAILGVVVFFALVAKVGERFGGAASAEEEGSASAANGGAVESRAAEEQIVGKGGGEPPSGKGGGGAAGDGRQALVDQLQVRQRQLELSADPERGGLIDLREGTGGVHIEQALGRTIRRASEQGADFVDPVLGPVSLKGPLPTTGPGSMNLEGLASSAIKDATKNSATKTLFVDLTGLTPEQANQVKGAIEAGTKGSTKVIRYLQ